jgi:hypothetical protein
LRVAIGGLREDQHGAEEGNAQSFVSKLRRIAASGEVVRVEDTEFGRKYTVPGDLKGSAGSAQVLTVWIQEAGQGEVRLVTVSPR